MSASKNAVLLASVIVATWAVTYASVGTAQSSVPNGVFVQDSEGWIWLVLESKRINVPVWQASDEEIRALPKSDRWAVMNDAGAIIEGDPPAWLQAGGDAPLTGQHPPRPAAPLRVHVVQEGETLARIAAQYGVTPDSIFIANGVLDRSRVFRAGERIVIPDPSQVAATPTVARPQLLPTPRADAPRPDRDIIEGVAGQQATGTFSGERVRATVVEMLMTSSLRSVQRTSYSSFPERTPAGTFVVVLVDVENIGTKPVCCLPGWRLRDSKGRYFSGDTNQADDETQHAALVFYPDVKYESGDYQPNLPRRRVLIYDIPTDASGLTLASDGR